MKTEVIGDGEPEYAIVGAIHGNEAEGWEAIQRFIDSDYELNQSVKAVMANEEAVENGERFVEKDLNRVFPGDRDGVHEERLAADLLEELEGLKVLDLHTTGSKKSPFAIITHHGETERELARSTGMDHLIDMTYVEGGMLDYLEAVAVEASRKGDTTGELYDTILNFLAAEGVIEEEYERTDPEFFEVYDLEEGAGYEFLAENFEPVEQGEVYARKDGDQRVAEESFHPVLMSTDGYDELIGFKSKKEEL